MASLTDLIRNFQGGGLTHDEFIASIDRALADGRANARVLARELSDEHTRFPLPNGVYDEVMRRIESRSAATQFDPAGEQTRVMLDASELSDSSSQPNALHGSAAAPAHTRSQSSQAQQASGAAGAAGAADARQLTALAAVTNLHAGAIPATGAAAKGVGDTLNGRFVLEECVGVGGMGTVYKALDLRKLEASDRQPYVAIKVLNVQFSVHPKSLIALQREARKAQQLAHRNIVTVYDFDRDGPTVYLTMEFLSGNSLNAVLRKPGFAGMPYAQALPIIQGMCRALAYAHERGFVHCDFKPANVFLTDRGEVKVIDFGIARGFRQPADESEQTVFDPGSLGGMTPAYASPEMIEHLEPDPRDDIYALACVTYELLTGKHPYERLSATLARSKGAKPVQPPGLTRHQWKTLCTALSLNRATRTPTVLRFSEGLGAEPRLAASRLPVMVAAAAGVVLAAGVGYYAWRTGAGSSANRASSGAVSGGPVQASAPVARDPRAEPRLALEAVLPVLGAIPCSLLSARVQGDGLHVGGYLSSSFGAKRLQDELAAVPGVTALDIQTTPLADDKCDVVKLIAPYWRGRQPDASAATLRTRGDAAAMTEGTPLVMDITTPQVYESYVYVDYFVVDGKVAHLVPSARVQGNQAPVGYSATVGDSGDWVISKPFGNELIVLVTTPAPLFTARRQPFESRQDYLRALEKPLAQMAAKYGKDRVSADLVQISTRAR
jgi:hypothetical protein